MFSGHIHKTFIHEDQQHKEGFRHLGFSYLHLMYSLLASTQLLFDIYSQCGLNVTIFGKIDHLRTSTGIHFLLLQERYIHALSKNTNCLTIDGQVCFYRRLFTDAVKPRGCISWSWDALIGLHGVPNCSSRQSWPLLWIVSVHVTY